MTFEEAGSPGTGLVGHFSPDTVRRLRATLANALQGDRRRPRCLVARAGGRATRGRGRTTRPAASAASASAGTGTSACTISVSAPTPARRAASYAAAQSSASSCGSTLAARARSQVCTSTSVVSAPSIVAGELVPPPGSSVSRSTAPGASSAVNSAVDGRLPPRGRARLRAVARARRAGAGAGSRGSRSRARRVPARPTPSHGVGSSHCASSSWPATREKPAHARR